MPKYRQNIRQAAHGQLPRRTLEWLANGTDEGKRNAEMFFSANQFRDAGYKIDEAYPRILARALADGLFEAEVRKAVDSAYSRAPRAPIGSAGSWIPPGHKNAPGTAPGPVASSLGGAVLPPAIADGFVQFLLAVFATDEYVAISEAIPDGKGEFAPGPGQTLKREKWLELFRHGKFAKMFPDGTGVYVRINPMKPGGKTDNDVTVFRHVLAEFDLDENGSRIPLETQYQTFLDSKLPISALTFSGDKSLHALIKVDAANRQEFDQRRETVWRIFAGFAIDEQNKNPSRYSRAPGFIRTLFDANGTAVGQGEQQLLALGLGSTNWESWERIQNSSFPEIVTGAELRTVIVPLPPDIIAGIIAQGEKGQLAGGSKSFKTWSLVDQAISVANGAPWWGLSTVQTDVLYLNLEIPRAFFEARIREIARIRGLIIPDNFGVWHLRGCNLADPDNWNEFLDRLADYCSGLTHPYLITDPIYKLLAGRNENAAGDVGAMLWQLEEMISATGGTNFFGHHFSKGDSSSKAAIDRGAGSGVFSRDPDTILVMTGNGAAQYSLEAILRNHIPVAPFVVEWKPPIFLRNDAIDPAGIVHKRGSAAARGLRGPLPSFTVDLLVKWLASDVLSTQQFKVRLMQETGMSRSMFYQLLKTAQDQQLIYFDTTSKTWEVPMKPL